MPQHNKQLAVAKLTALGISNIILVPNMRLLDNIIAHNRLIVSTDFLRVLAEAHGQPLLQIITNIGQHTSSREFSAVLLDVIECISHGNSFSTAIARHSAYFDKIAVAQITIGEETGQMLEHITCILKQREQKIADLKILKKTLTYPVFLLVIASCILLAFIMLVIPTVSDSVCNLTKSDELENMMLLANWLNEYLTVGIRFIFASICCYALFPKRHNSAKNNTKLKYHVHKIMYYAPQIHKFYRLSFISAFARNLSTLLAVGVDITSAFDILIKLERNSYLARNLAKAKNLVIKGFPLSKSLEHILPTADLNTAEIANTVTCALSHMAQKYEMQLKEDLSAYMKLLEPGIIILTAFIIGTILLSIYIPLISIAEMI